MTYRPPRKGDYLSALLADPRCTIHPDNLLDSNVADLKVLAAWYQIPVYPSDWTGTGLTEVVHMPVSEPKPGENFRAKRNARQKVTIVAMVDDEVRYKYDDGTEYVTSRSVFVQNWVPMDSLLGA